VSLLSTARPLRSRPVSLLGPAACLDSSCCSCAPPRQLPQPAVTSTQCRATWAPSHTHTRRVYIGPPAWASCSRVLVAWFSQQYFLRPLDRSLRWELLGVHCTESVISKTYLRVSSSAAAAVHDDGDRSETTSCCCSHRRQRQRQGCLRLYVHSWGLNFSTVGDRPELWRKSYVYSIWLTPPQ